MTYDLVFSLFAKDIHELTKDDLINFFETERSETDKIEFKSYVDQQIPGTVKAVRDNDKISEIVKTICGFLNSDGGILLWGAPKGEIRSGGKERVYKGELRPVDFLIEQDQFINKVSMQISPTPLRIRYKVVEIEPGKFLYVVHVSKSEYAPHQYKGTYYMRMDGSTVAAPHHYVEALMKKITFPRIEVFLSFDRLIQLRSESAIIPMQLAIHNLSRYLPEKNIQAKIVSDNCVILKPNVETAPPTQHNSDLLLDKIEILHHRVPHFEHFFIVLDRFRTSNDKFTINVLANGDLSPVITSTYEIHIYRERNYNMLYEVISKKENIYLFDHNASDKPEMELIDKINSDALNKFMPTISETIMYKILRSGKG